MAFTAHPPPSDRLEFRSWRNDDLALAESLWGDAAVMQYLGGPYSRDEVLARLATEAQNQEQYGFQYWPVFLRESGAFAGCCGLKPVDMGQWWLETGFHFRPEFWGQGLAAEAARTVIRFAFDERNAAALFAGCHPGNTSSAALLERLGFTQIGTHFFARTGLDHSWYRLATAP